MNATSELIAALVAGGMDAASAAGLVARAGVEMTGALTRNMSSGNSASNPVESPEYRTLEKRRAWDRERKRAAKLRSANSTGIPHSSTGIPPEDAEIPCDLKGKKEAPKGEVKKESKKGSRLLKDARMSGDDHSFALSTGIPPERVDAEWAEFVDYWIGVPGTRGCKLDWPATWRNRVREQVAKKYRGRNGNAISNHRTDPAAGRATAREAHHVATMGSAALRYLQEGKSVGPGRESPDGAGPASVPPSHKGTENAH